MWRVFLVTAFFLAKGKANDCVPYIVENEVVACVCNATYCDDTPDNVPKIPTEGTSYWYVSNKEGLRMAMSTATFSNSFDTSSNVTLTIDREKKYQTILGFGGAFTDSVGINIGSLSQATQNQLMRAYFCPKTGSGYTIGRIPIGATDYSLRPYSYDDHTNDTSLQYFSLAPEDYEYKIPYARKALELNPEVKFFASAWSAPGWMKTNGKFLGYGFLKKEYYSTFAEYLARFVDEYSKNGLNLWAVTTGNEPTIGLLMLNNTNIIDMGWTPETMAEFVGNFMGPTLSSLMKRDRVVIALDDEIALLPWFVEPIFRQENASKYTIGTGVHWYTDNVVPMTNLDETHNQFPDKLLMMTEASIMESIWGTSKHATKSWDHGEMYISSIINYANNWGVGWVDWNLALDENGGPSWFNSTLDSPIIVNPSRDEFYKQPMYYAIQHFSKFVGRGSVKISITNTDTIKSTAFLTPLDEVVVVLYNSNNSTSPVTLNDAQHGALHLELSPYSMNTVIYEQ